MHQNLQLFNYDKNSVYRTDPKMAATVSVLRKILFDVCPPKILVDRKTERPLLPPEIAQDKVRMVTTKEEAFRFASEIKEYMVRSRITGTVLCAWGQRRGFTLLAQ